MAAAGRDPRLGQFRHQAWHDELDDYDRASIAVDCVLLTVLGQQLRLLLYLRPLAPALGEWAVPGAFVNFPEAESDAVMRAVKTKTGVSLGLEPNRLTWSADPYRDERGWVVTLAYYAVAEGRSLMLALPSRRDDVVVAPVFVPPAVTEAQAYAHVPIPGVAGTDLAFDHNHLVAQAVVRLRRDLRSGPAALALLPDEFSMRELQGVYETVLGERFSRATFQRLVADLQLIEPTGDWEPAGVGRRRAQLYRARSI